METRSGLTWPALATSLLVFAVGVNDARAQGASCATLAGTDVTIMTPPGPPNNAVFPGGPFSFNEGDQLEFLIEELGGPPFDGDILLQTSTPSASVNPSFTVLAVSTRVVTTAPVTSTSYDLSASITTGGPGSIRVTFVGCLNSGSAASSELNEQRQQAQAAAAAAVSFSQQSAAVLGRVARGNRQNGADADVSVSALPQTGIAGAAGQGADSFGVWGDFTWSGLQNDDANTGASGHAFTLSGGYDTPVTDRLVAGAAVSVGGAIFDLKNSDAETSEINFGVTPYIGYQLDDVFSLQAAAGYIHARGRSDVTGDDGGYGVNRYFLVGEASAFQTWDEISLFSSIGVLWGQSFQARYTDDSGNRSGSARTQLGSVSVTAQPSYLFTIDEADGVFIEPYLLGQYSYDFSQTKTRGAANDPDEFLIGGGANAFHGDGLSGALEFSRTLGREDNTATTTRATVRMDF